jgi:hypothetical protein
MADHADDGDNNDVFIYMGGEVPLHLRGTITHAIVDRSVKIISAWAFMRCRNLVSLEMHDGVEIIGSFRQCKSLRIIKLTGVKIIGYKAFEDCPALADVEFGDKLETIAEYAFYCCISLRNIKLSKIRNIGSYAFYGCKQLAEVELSENLEFIGSSAFVNCRRLRHIVIPLERNLLGWGVFINCVDLSQVDLVGETHQTISSLLLDSWRNEMKDDIDRINQVLPNTATDENKTTVIRQWMERVLERMEHYKSEHYALLKEDMTQLELALWKSNLPNIDAAESRHEARVTCGANIIIPHVLSFLNDEEVFPTVLNIPL